jgi:hypothetical protein
MKYEHDGITIWFGTADAPAPGEAVSAGRPTSVTIGVRPQNASHDVKVLYRVNKSADKPNELEAKWIRSDASGKGQYYRAEFPSFQPGDRVDYTPVCRCVDKQVPHPAEWPTESKRFAASFKVIDAALDNAIEGKHAASLNPASVIPPGYSDAVPVVRVRKDYSAPSSYSASPRADAPLSSNGDERYHVDGKVVSPSRAGVGGLRVEILDKNICDDVYLAEAVTDEGGGYAATFTMADFCKRGKQRPDLQVRAFAGPTFLGASEVRYNASDHETLNVLLTEEMSSALPSEHETLTGELARHYSGRLADLEESDDRGDITYLANKSGWDARAVAMAALAEQFSAMTPAAGGAGIHSAFYYALFRAGLPSNPDTLYQADPQTVEQVWKRATEEGVIPNGLQKEIPTALQAFQSLGAEKLLTSPALVGASSMTEMLTSSGLNEEQQRYFAALYVAHRADLPTFWQAIGDAFGKNVANRLQLDGKLTFLTINNAKLMQRIHAAGENNFVDPLQLAQEGYYRPEAWRQLLTGDVPVPKEIPGETQEVRQANYADYLASQVRLSYPTAAVAHMIKSDDLPLRGAALRASDQVHDFLSQHQGKFEIGVQPVQQYIARNNLQVADEIVTQVKRLQRVYQITPSDEAMTGLMKHGLDAAYHVVRHDRDAFVRTYQQDLGGAESAAQTYDRSVQVHNAVLNIAISYITARNGIGLGAERLEATRSGLDGSGQILRPAPRGRSARDAADVIAYPTLEGLFGSMDFCACDHCRSVLSPAAYLVDLLQFIDQPPPPEGPVTENPQTVLLDRRPDIQHLPLTCENTNTVLPYIDVVNETLEYFIANTVQKNSLNGYLGHDTNGVASEDLLAVPQFVVDAAYTTLRGEYFPAPLPFHQPLENLRRYFDKFGVPLPLAMERLRKTDDLERGKNSYGWRDILMEEIRLSRDEYEILTNSAAVPLWRMYGFPTDTSDADVINTPFFFIGTNRLPLSNAKLFCRHVGISYEDLVAILETRLVNPNSDLIPKLERLGVALSTLKAFKEGTITDEAFEALLPQGAYALDPAQYGGDIKAWVKNDANYARIMGLITLAIPVNTWTASMAYGVGDCVLPTAPQAGSTLYYKCTTAGTSAASEPEWPTTPGNTYTDGTVVWTCRDASNCHSFDDLAFRYSDPAKITQNIDAAEFVCLLRFIRLWKKMSWSVEQTDAVICALYRTDLSPITAEDVDTAAKLDAGFLTLLPRLGIIVRVMKALNLTASVDLLPLLACWSEIGTRGSRALYRQMFLNLAMLKQDAVFADNGYGNYLQRAQVAYTHPQATLDQAIVDAAEGKIGYNDFIKLLSYSGILDPTTRDALKAVPGVSPDFQEAVDGLFRAQRLATHTEALRSAFNLTGNEYEQIVSGLGYNADTPLTLPNISAIFRHGWLARKLNLSVRELLLLTQLTGLDPFAVPDPTDPAIMRVIRLSQALKERSLKTSAALYLIWNQDLSGKSAPDPAQITEFARTLRGDFAAIDDQLTATEDPSGDVTRARIALVYGQETSDVFLALLDDTLALDVAYTQPKPTLEAAITAVDPSIAYDNFRHRLSRTGLLSVTTRDALINLDGVAEEFKGAVETLFARGEDIKGSFFVRHPELKSLYDIYVASADPVDKKRGALLAALHAELGRRRKRQQALQRISAAAGVDLVFAQVLLDTPAAPYPLHAAKDTARPALDDALALETPGLAVQFFFRDTATEHVDLTLEAASSLNYAADSGNRLPTNPVPDSAVSGIWRGQVEAPEAGFYNFVVEADSGATVKLQLGGLDRNPFISPTSVTQNVTVWRNIDPLELKAGGLYDIVLTIEKVKDTLRVKWETPKRAREVIPARYLYPPTVFGPFSDAYIRLRKAAALADGLHLTAGELAHFATDPDYLIALPKAPADTKVEKDGWLNVLPVSGDPAPEVAVALLQPLQALLDYTRAKTTLSLADDSLLRVLQDPAEADGTAKSSLFALTRWDPVSLKNILAHFDNTKVTDLAHFEQFRRVHDALALIRTMGLPASALIQATINAPDGAVVRDFQSALHARYDIADWRDVVQPINDELRGLQRDALVAYILHQMRSNSDTAHIDTPEKLFEYFLMDVQMEPCMQTSRIRHALSSVQLFIERCLMNLEPRVSPAAFNVNQAKQWEWMKRYRVWEANRKVFLWPENWLEPELRDDKSPFFREIESELLQNDITEDTATTALLKYLSKLEEVAKLEPCGIHDIDPDPSRRTGHINHVIARTAGANRKYFYRRREGGSWSPWEHVELDVDDNPAPPVIWKDRLFLFWLRILTRPGTAQPPLKDVGADINLTQLKASNINTDPPSMSVGAVLCWSEYYNGKWQPTKTSDVNHPVGLIDVSGGTFDRSRLHLSCDEGKRGDMRIAIDLDLKDGQPPLHRGFLLYNTHSLPTPWYDLDPVLDDWSGLYIPKNGRGWYGVDGVFGFSYQDFEDMSGGFRNILNVGKRLAYSIVEPRHAQVDQWNDPVFFQDSQHLFFVTTTTPSMEPLYERHGYGVATPIFNRSAQIPPPFFETSFRQEVGPKFGGDGGSVGPDLVFIDLPRMRRLAENPYIRKRIATNGVVMYRNERIGAAGAL